MKWFIATVPFFILGCGAVTLTEQAAYVIALTEEDKPNCTFISKVAASGGDYFNSFDGNFRAGFNAAMNAVASAGGDAYTILRSDGTWGRYYEMEAWQCGWDKGHTQVGTEPVSVLQEITGTERKGCAFITTIAEGSNWGITTSRNRRSAEEDALKRVREAGGDSYFIVNVLQTSGSVGFIIEAWRCH